MESTQGDEHVLHIFISNQSMAMTIAEIEVTIDGQQIFHREMATGTQYNVLGCYRECSGESAPRWTPTRP